MLSSSQFSKLGQDALYVGLPPINQQYEMFVCMEHYLIVFHTLTVYRKILGGMIIYLLIYGMNGSQLCCQAAHLGPSFLT